jgi:PAS domain S-box-containing protein
VRIEVSVTVSPVRDRWGQVIGAAFIARDLTHTRHIEGALQHQQAKEKYGSIFENAREGIFYTTFDGRTASANPALVRILGYESAEELAGDHLHLLGSWNAAEGQGLWSPLEEERGARDFEMEGRRRDGSKIWVSARMVVLRDASAKPVAFQGSILDITEHKRSEESLRGVSSEADKANVAKTQFLSRMSHELRTPLTAILGFGQLLERGRLSDKQQHGAIDNILKAGRHLQALIDEATDIAGIEGGRTELSLGPVRARDAISEALGLIAPSAAQRGIVMDTIKGDDEGYLLADRQRLIQVLLNVLSNAVKYNNENGRIVVACARTASALTIKVSDTGPGIAPAMRDRIFTPFERLGAERSGVEGTGLGLALSLKLVEAMGGTMAFDSVEGDGSTFLVTLPSPSSADIALLRPHKSLPDDESKPELGTSTILYIEDALENLQLMQLILDGRPGVRLISAMHGRLGLELAVQHKPDLILLDLHLPDMGGQHILEELKARPATWGIPVVILSAESPTGEVDRLLKAGALAYLTKPFDIDELLAIFDDTLGAIGGGGRSSPGASGRT